MATETELANRLERFRSRLRSIPQIDRARPDEITHPRKHWLETADRWWAFVIKGVPFVIKGVFGLASVLAFAVIAKLFYEALFGRSVVIEPISVPKDMEAAGYTPDVAALHLLDAMNKYVVRARTSGAGPKLALHKDEADFTLPNVGLSFKAVVSRLTSVIPIAGNQNISGEIMRVGEELRLRLRRNGVVVYETSMVIPGNPDGVDAKNLKKDLTEEALKTLFDDAALGIFAVTRPYFEAVGNSDKNPEAASELAKKFIAEKRSDWPLDQDLGRAQKRSDWPRNQDVGWAHNLPGLLLYEKGTLHDHNSHPPDQKSKADHDNSKAATHRAKPNTPTPP